MPGFTVPDPFGTLARALWVGGGQWAGKTTVTGLLARRYGLTAYHYDFHDARAHNDRRVADRARAGEPLDGPSREAEWVRTTPEDMAERALAGFPQRFGWVLEDLAALDSPRPIVAEGWGLRPDLVAVVADDPARMVVLVPTSDFRVHQQQHLARAAAVDPTLSDPDRAQRNRLGRDQLLALDATRRARALGMTVIEVDGTRDPEAVTDLLEGQFAPFL